jgi:uncharacterized membrane protein YfcA
MRRNAKRGSSVFSTRLSGTSPRFSALGFSIDAVHPATSDTGLAASGGGMRPESRRRRDGGGKARMSVDFLLLAAVGFLAQIVDGALGMAFGVISSSAMLSLGLPPAHASAIAHTAEIFTTATSGASHVYFRNVDWRLVLRLGVAGVVGAVAGAWFLSNIDGHLARPFVAAYLLAVGILILLKAFRRAPVHDPSFAIAPPLGLVGGFLDASGGGGWGPVVTSTLIGSGQAPRTVVGSVNVTEFFIAAAAATTFFIELGAAPLRELSALVLGGVLAAPFGGWVVKHVAPRLLMTLVGVLVILLAVWQLVRAFELL